MEKLQVKIKKLDERATIPSQAHETDAGYDLVALDDAKVVFEEDIQHALKYLNYIEYRTGIAIEPPDGYHFEIYPRSSVSKMGLVLANSIGLIDASYRGELILRFKPVMTVTDIGHPVFTKFYKAGEKIGQLVLKKTNHAEFVQVDELSDTKRGDGAFGSTGE